MPGTVCSQRIFELLPSAAAVCDGALATGYQFAKGLESGPDGHHNRLDFLRCYGHRRRLRLGRLCFPFLDYSGMVVLPVGTYPDNRIRLGLAGSV